MHTEYQDAAMRTMPSLSVEQLPNWALGLCGEIGEVMQDLQNGKPVVIEVGDVLWYCHAILTCLKVDADSVLADLVPQEFDWGAPCRIAELVKKHIYHFKPLDKTALVQEVRTVIQGCLHLLGATSLQECYRQNVVKLLRRYPEGFNG